MSASAPRANHGRAAVLALVAAVLLAGCGTSATPSRPDATGTAGMPSATPTAMPTSPSITDPPIGATFPPSQTPIEPGTYRWDGFGHAIAVTLGAGWDLGHDKPTLFDLFRGNDFPAITFARFTEVYADGSTKVPAMDAATAVATLLARSDMTVTTPATIDLGGLAGRQFDVTTTVPRTPLFFGASGDFRLDPEFRTRYRILDFPGGGILVIGIHAHLADFDAAVALADPVVATFSVGP